MDAMGTAMMVQNLSQMMYGTPTYIDHKLGPNLGKYSIDGASRFVSNRIIPWELSNIPLYQPALLKP